MRLPHLAELGAVRHHARNVESLLSGSVTAVEAVSRTILRRSTCTGSAQACEKPVSGNTGVLPIVLGAVIPLVCAAVVLLYLHQRLRRKQRAEDASDPHKSLDFGVNEPVAMSNRGKGRKGGLPEMLITDMSLDPTKHTRGLSMDMLGSPYMLPPGLQGSKESLHSMTRAMPDENDPYRPVAWARDSQETSRSQRARPENGSVYSASTLNTVSNEHATLVANARPMSQSFPVREESRDRKASEEPHPLRQTTSLNEASKAVNKDKALPLPSPQSGVPSLSVTPTFAPITLDREEPAILMPPPRTSSARQNAVAVTTVVDLVDHRLSEASYYEDDVLQIPQTMVSPPLPQIAEPDDYSSVPQGRFSIDTPQPSQQYPVPAEHRLSAMGLRPLPPDHPEENAEQRANRIRSFYREYFDDSKPNPSGQYEEDWDADYTSGAIYDQYGDPSYYEPVQQPYAQPYARRAMTPPPSGARFAPGGGPHARHFSMASGGHRPYPRGRPGGPMPRQQKQLPLPQPLKSLPTPHMLKDDNALFISADFAPRQTFRDVQNGRRPDSPLGAQRPFSPNVRSYSPLVPAFDELTAIPSPHHLRKSGTFSNLDFAKLPRFRGQTESANASDAGSIRSARSGISAMQVDAVRAGAYRVSRIPKEFVTTKDDLSMQLRPKMNLVTPS